MSFTSEDPTPYFPSNDLLHLDSDLEDAQSILDSFRLFPALTRAGVPEGDVKRLMREFLKSAWEVKRRPGKVMAGTVQLGNLVKPWTI